MPAPAEPNNNTGVDWTRLWPLLVFTAAYLAASVVGAFSRGNQEFVFYIAVMIALVIFVAALHLRVRFSLGLLWALSIWGLLHMAGGLVPVPEIWPIHGEIRVLYSLWLVPDRLKYDQVVHAYGFGITTWACWQALQSAIAARLEQPRDEVAPSWGLVILCMAAGMGFGAANEVVEFFATLMVPETNVGGYVNTGWDLVSNTVGCLIAGATIRAGVLRGG